MGQILEHIVRAGSAPSTRPFQREDGRRPVQGFLFEPEAITLTELQDAIARLDFRTASERLQEFRRLWPEAKLIWEPELILTGLKLARDSMNLDSGYDAWQELQVQLGALDVPRAITASMKQNFFSRLLETNCTSLGLPRTAAGRSLGYFHLSAGQPRNARRCYENEIRQIGDGWSVRLQLGNCGFRLGYGPVAHSNYHWSFVLGLTENRWTWIEDSVFLSRLRR
jgi:hypothetical protein